VKLLARSRAEVFCVLRVHTNTRLVDLPRGNIPCVVFIFKRFGRGVYCGVEVVQSIIWRVLTRGELCSTSLTKASQIISIQVLAKKTNFELDSSLEAQIYPDRSLVLSQVSINVDLLSGSMEQSKRIGQSSVSSRADVWSLKGARVGQVHLQGCRVVTQSIHGVDSVLLQEQAAKNDVA